MTLSALAPVVCVRTTDTPDPAWADLVSTTSGGDVAQLPGWATLRSTVGFTASYVQVYVGGELAGGAQVLERSLPLLGNVGYIPCGPLLSERYNSNSAARTALADALTDLAEGRLRMLFVQPPVGAEQLSGALLARGFRPSDADIAPGRSLQLDLTNDLATLRGGLSKRLRTWTNRWSARGVTVRPGTEADLGLLAALVADTGEHQGFAAVGEDYLRTLYRELGDDAVLFVGELDGVAVAAALFTRCAGTLKLRFAGMNRDEAASKCNVPAAVQWHAIGWAKRSGLRWFDFGGIGADAAAVLSGGGGRAEVRGVDRFKASFGGALYHCPPAVELIPSRLLRATYDLSRRWSVGRRALELAKAVLRTGRAKRS